MAEEEGYIYTKQYILFGTDNTTNMIIISFMIVVVYLIQSFAYHG